MSTTPLTGTLVVCVAAAGIAAGALFIEAGDNAPGPAPAATADPTATGPGSPGRDGYGSSGSPAGDAAAAEPATLAISNFRFAPATAEAGGRVTVVNRDGAPHTVTADDGAFDTGQVDGGASLTFTAPDRPGTYSFRCGIHPDMRGTLTVR